jgi:chemotaxis protein CheD
MNPSLSAIATVDVEPRPRHVIGIGEYAVTGDPDATIVTHALGSCVAVCVWDPDAHVGAMLHFLLPESKLNSDRARKQPGAFADTGLPLLFQTAYERGLNKKRCRVHLVGGAAVGGGGPDIGKRNVLAARRLLWQNGVMLKGEDVGGHAVRTVTMHVASGQVQITNGRNVVGELG